MRIPVLFLSLLLLGVSADAQTERSRLLCSSDWLSTASGAAVRALIRGGADLDEHCTRPGRNRPLHQALLTPGVDPDVVRALVEGGADLYQRNSYGENPLNYAQERYDRASSRLRPGTASYRRERAIYELMFDRAGPSLQQEAAMQLCDGDWWRSSADASSVRALLARPGVDPNARCNNNNDRPLHVALSLLTFRVLPEGVKDGVLALAASRASLSARNNSGESPLALAEVRYDRYHMRARTSRPAWCSGGAADPDIEAYVGVKALATGESPDRLTDATRREVCGGGDVPRQVGAVFRECDACPEMVVMPGGRLALGRYEVTVDEYRAFASAAGGAGGGCYSYVQDADGVGWDIDLVASLSWRNPGFSQSGRHPVVCVSWNDAQEYVSWLSRTTGATYRLPSEGEWSRGAGGSSGGCGVNGGDAGFVRWLESTFGGKVSDQYQLSCAGSDGSVHTAAVGSYGSNGVGLSDMVGNVWEWTEDCWEGDCGRRVVRGGSWFSYAEYLRPGARRGSRAGTRRYPCGFRVARTLD